MSHNDATVTLWTAQRQIVLDTLALSGLYQVKGFYVEEKYQEAAWSFQEAYSFFRESAPSRLPRPEGAESGVWLYSDPKWLELSHDTHLLKFEIPSDKVLLFDMRLWNRILNLEYIGADRRDQEAFQQDLERSGLKNTIPLFRTPFYPMLRRRVRQSWQRLFDSDKCPVSYRQAGTWELRSEWLRTQ